MTEYRQRVQAAEDKWDAAHPQGRRVMTIANLRDFCDSIPAPAHRDTWGNWRLNLRGEPSLDFDGDSWSRSNPYYVELNSCAGDFLNALMTVRKFLIVKVQHSPIRRCVKERLEEISEKADHGVTVA